MTMRKGLQTALPDAGICSIGRAVIGSFFYLSELAAELAGYGTIRYKRLSFDSV
ncbi:MAG: hypothetical protein LUG90_13215 [Clostridiaceae bacterium]|nr:hypothetical protein [Clostridiaceae bacterium]